MRLYFLLIILILVFKTGTGHAQNYLSLRVKDRTYRQFIPGKEISVTVQNGIYTNRVSGIIDSIGDDIIFVNGDKVYLQDVLKVHINRGSFNYRSGGINLMLAGTLLATLLYTNDREADENRPFYIASGILFTGGVAMFSYAVRTFSMNEKNKLMIIKPI
ncbi:MAG: hypothetical protein ACXWEY_04775 [Bacteroidia bacterium]